MSDLIERTETAKITKLSMGSTIPDWLLAADPKVAGAPKGNWRFDCDVVVIELADDFYVVPIIEPGKSSGCSILDLNGMAAHHWYAASKPVRVIHAMNSVFPIEFTEAVQEQQRRIAEAMQAPPGEWTAGPTPSAEKLSPRPRFSLGVIFPALIVFAGVLGYAAHALFAQLIQ